MRRLSTVLLYCGAAACLLGVAGTLMGAWISLPPRAVKLVAMSVPFVVGAVLLIVGAAAGRVARHEDDTVEIEIPKDEFGNVPRPPAVRTTKPRPKGK
jgi:hypothetical protein